MTLGVRVVSAGSIESAPKFRKKQKKKKKKKKIKKFDTDETSVAAREEIIEHNML